MDKQDDVSALRASAELETGAEDAHTGMVQAVVEAQESGPDDGASVAAFRAKRERMAAPQRNGQRRVALPPESALPDGALAGPATRRHSADGPSRLSSDRWAERFSGPPSPGESSSGGSSHQATAPDPDAPDPRIAVFERWGMRLGMPAAAIKSWRNTVSRPWIFCPFHTTLAPATMALVLATYIGGTSHLGTTRRMMHQIVTAVNVAAHAANFTGVWLRGPQFIEERPRLAGAQLALHVITSSFLEWSMLLLPEAKLPYQSRIGFLALLTAEHWCGFASAISGGIPWCAITLLA
jgi:hypothetical protein